MAKIRAFRGTRPVKDLADKIAELPYDVVSLPEVIEIAGKNPYNFYHVTRSEMDLAPGTDPYSPEVYRKAKETYDLFKAKGYMVEDKSPIFYLYSQVMAGRMQTGIVACADVDDYLNEIIKKHELTREEKELDRTRHIDATKANTGPVFLIYRDSDEKRKLVEMAMKVEPVYDITADDGIRHIVRLIDDKSLIFKLEESFLKDELYIADGHHRAASAVRVISVLAPDKRRTRGMPARPAMPVPRRMRWRIVSAWSSAVWAVTTYLAPHRAAAAARKPYRRARVLASASSRGSSSTAGLSARPTSQGNASRPQSSTTKVSSAPDASPRRR